MYDEREVRTFLDVNISTCPRCDKIILKESWEGYCQKCVCDGCTLDGHCHRICNGTWKECDTDGHLGR